MIILLFFSGLLSIMFIFWVLGKQDQTVRQVMKHNKNVLPLYKMKAEQLKADRIRLQLESNDGNQPEARYKAIENTLNELNSMYQNNNLSINDYNTGLDRLSRQI